MIRALLLAAVLVGCAATPAEPEQSDCERDVETAAAVDAMSDAHEDLHPAFESCATIADMEAASELFPDAFDGVDVSDYARTRCEFEPLLAGTPICEEVGR